LAAIHQFGPSFLSKEWGVPQRAICKIARAKSEIARLKRQFVRDKSQLTRVIFVFAHAKSQFTRTKWPRKATHFYYCWQPRARDYPSCGGADRAAAQVEVKAVQRRQPTTNKNL
jgi:hypothetical protein